MGALPGAMMTRRSVRFTVRLRANQHKFESDDDEAQSDKETQYPDHHGRSVKRHMVSGRPGSFFEDARVARACRQERALHKHILSESALRAVARVLHDRAIAISYGRL